MIRVPTIFIVLLIAACIWLPFALLVRDLFGRWLPARLLARFDVSALHLAIRGELDEPAQLDSLEQALIKAGVDRAVSRKAAKAARQWALTATDVAAGDELNERLERTRNPHWNIRG